MPSKPHQLNTSLLAIIAEGFLSRLSFGLITFALPLYAHHLGLSMAEIGFLISLNVMVALALKPAMGWMADHFGLKRSLAAGISLRSLIALLLAFAGSPWQLYAIRTAHGMSQSLRDPPVNALLAEHGGKKSIASAFAWYQTAKSVAGSLGKVVAGVLLTLTASNFSLVFLVASFLSALPVFLIARYVREHREVKEEETASEAPDNEDIQASNGAMAARPAILSFMGLGFLITGTAQMLHGLFPILATKYIGLSEAETGAIYLISTLMVLFAGPFFGWLSDNVSRKLVLMVRGSANIFSSIIYIAVPNFLGVAVGRVTDDVGKAAFRPAWGALMAHVSSFDKRRRARTMSYMSMGEDAGDIAGPILAGFLWSTWGLTITLGARVVLAIVTEIYAMVVTRSMRKREASSYTRQEPAAMMVLEK
ncbi:MAG: MFS transporter [bacterium]